MPSVQEVPGKHENACADASHISAGNFAVCFRRSRRRDRSCWGCHQKSQGASAGIFSCQCMFSAVNWHNFILPGSFVHMCFMLKLQSQKWSLCSHQTVVYFLDKVHFFHLLSRKIKQPRIIWEFFFQAAFMTIRGFLHGEILICMTWSDSLPQRKSTILSMRKLI